MSGSMITVVQSRMTPAVALNKAIILRQLLAIGKTEFLMEAHDGLSAIIAEQAGFKAIWASGFSISAACGVRDSNELSWTQVLDVVGQMVDRTSVPILADGDTGYGNFNNVRILVEGLIKRGIAGVCIEDKRFPKTSSLADGHHDLAEINEFCGRIRAGIDHRDTMNPDFVIVARTEALIAGAGIDEAFRRASIYHEVGADAILVHSKQKTADEILEFATRWERRCPLLIVPTRYYQTPTEEFEKAGVTVIWGNHSIRAAIKAMEEVCISIYKNKSVVPVEAEKKLASVERVFELVKNDELTKAEERYLPSDTMLPNNM